MRRTPATWPALRRPGGPRPKFLLTEKATCDAVLKAIATASSDLESGDLFFLTYSGHGGQVQDVDGDEKDDQLDETWCLFDSQLRDDDINTALASFAEGVRILMLSDSCHSGTVSRGIALERDQKLEAESCSQAPSPRCDEERVRAARAASTRLVRSYLCRR